ncbi:4'-phosphopantetheinyl transferase superfamily protein [Lysobacter sp. 5GHs7-4]|uniref:4'-phosphopantetheinyl transferase family protein n=1 Tax=Lysobacter sp. 5GHs7-4 TaxID=2904253 RepID=UPI001E363FE0|nr:4'-phosphopantetheinyl transferase superfamily protein [Lysobacter sp. 5GHs7-4]UHQ23222.1 4'-phosphopantetheinyl transferase superfamily protein [Lysobacter sp. 5GHs7-4]
MTPPQPLLPPRWTWQPHTPGHAAQAQAQAWLAQQLRTDPQALRLARDDRQRPYLEAPFQHWDCNWSHSGDSLLIALTAHGRVGVDLERLRPRPRALAVSERYFTAPETAWLDAQADRDRAFLRLWCLKEAVLKAHGHGLSFGLHRLRFEERDALLVLVDSDPALGAPHEWRLQELAPAPGYVGALAWRPRPGAPAPP